MPIKQDKQTYNYVGEIAALSAQSMVECRFPGDMVTVIAVNATAVLRSCEVVDGEVNYRGRVLLTVVYEDMQKKVCRSERGMEFSHRADDERCTPVCTADIKLKAERVTSRREGSGVYISVIVGADIKLFSPESIDFVTGGELVVKEDEGIATGKLLCHGDIEADDEFDTEYVGDILMHGETVNVTYVSTDIGVMSVSGEINLSICALKGDELVSYERLVPFKGDIPCDDAFKNMKCDASVCVKNVNINASTDEEKGKCRVRIDFLLGVSGTAYTESKMKCVSDAYSCENEVELVKEELKEEYLDDVLRFSERVSGVAAYNGKVDFSDSLKCVLLPFSSAECVKSDSGEHAEGAITAVIAATASDGSNRGIEITLPFSIPVKINSSGRREVSVMVCGLFVRQRREGEIEAEATLKISVKIYKTRIFKYISEIIEGEKIDENPCAFSVYMPAKGEGLWETAKRLKKTPEDVEKSNPELKFPLKGNERIIIYRKNGM